LLEPQVYIIPSSETCNTANGPIQFFRGLEGATNLWNPSVGHAQLPARQLSVLNRYGLSSGGFQIEPKVSPMTIRLNDNSNQLDNKKNANTGVSYNGTTYLL
jgi:hypothetical protein